MLQVGAALPAQGGHRDLGLGVGDPRTAKTLPRAGGSSRQGLGGQRGLAGRGARAAVVTVYFNYSPISAGPARARPGSAARLPGTSGGGTQVGGAGAGPERGTGWTVGKMAAAVAGPRGRGAADTDTDTDSGNGSGNGVGRSLILKHRRPPLWAASDLGGLSSLPRPSPPVGLWPFIPPAPVGVGNGSSGPGPATP